jgi:hypothetical protein
MTFRFDEETQNELETLRSEGRFPEAYQLIVDKLEAEAPDTDAIKPVSLWFTGAVQANAGEPPDATLIRSYTKRQGELHVGEAFTPDEMDRGSHAAL